MAWNIGGQVTPTPSIGALIGGYVPIPAPPPDTAPIEEWVSWVAEVRRRRELNATISGQVASSTPFLQEAPVGTHNIWDIKNFSNITDMGLFWLLLIYMAKTGHAQAVKEIMLTIFNGIFDSVQRYSSAAAANPVSAWGAGRLNSLLLERFGLISQTQACDFASGISIVAGVTATQGIMSAFPIHVNLGGGSEVQAGAFPAQVTNAETTYKTWQVGLGRGEGLVKPKGVSKSVTLEKKQ